MTRFELDIHLHQGAFTLSLSSVASARSIALFGPSGSGKTTAIEAIAGIRRPQRGRIAIDRRTLFDSASGIAVPPRWRKVGYVPQDVLLFPHLSVRRNVLFGASGRMAEPRPAIVEVLELSSLLDRRVDVLSGGERQRVALARALHASPEVLLLDEPLAAVDMTRRRRIIDALLRIRDDLRVPLIAVTHVPEEAALLAEHIILLDGGAVIAEGPAREMMARAAGTLDS